MTKAMRRLIKHKPTNMYLTANGHWTHEPSAAWQFENIQTILNIQRQFNLTEIEIVLQVGPEPSNEYDIALPLRNPLS
ncbi:MAG TPA: hypothetical protein VL361_22705 [Candidatus Limnocylindrales bacterium]|nr:hypothetical protein [Candidatus Limnocylindrales bacterium]